MNLSLAALMALQQLVGEYHMTTSQKKNLGYARAFCFIYFQNHRVYGITSSRILSSPAHVEVKPSSADGIAATDERASYDHYSKEKPWLCNGFFVLINFQDYSVCE